jgi:hypothetical protein
MNQKRDARPPKWTQFACHVRNFTDRAVSLTVPYFAIENMAKMSDAEHAQLLERNHARVAASTPEPQHSLAVAYAAPAVPDPQTPENALATAYADLAAAMISGDRQRAAELRNTVIPDLERMADASEPRAAPVSPDPSRPAATPGDTGRRTEGSSNW